MALKSSHELRGGVKIPDAYIRIGGYAVDPEARTINVQVKYYANEGVRTAEKERTASMHALAAEFERQGVILSATTELLNAAQKTGDPTRIAAAKDKYLRVYADTRIAGVAIEEARKIPLTAVHYHQDTNLIIGGEDAASIIAADGSVKLSDLYAVLKKRQFVDAADCHLPV